LKEVSHNQPVSDVAPGRIGKREQASGGADGQVQGEHNLVVITATVAGIT
jgi:hypothetical protein